MALYPVDSPGFLLKADTFCSGWPLPAVPMTTQKNALAEAWAELIFIGAVIKLLGINEAKKHK